MECRQTLECGDDGCCYSVAVQGDVVCVGVEKRVLLFSKARGALVRELGSRQIAGDVWGVAFINENTIVVAANRTLRMYTTDGQFVRSMKSGESQFAPRGLTVGPDGHIFVCDFDNCCVCVFKTDGTLLSSFDSWGIHGRYWKPSEREGDRFWSRFRPRDVCMVEGLLFITNANRSRICVHSVEGAFIREFPTPRQPCCVAATDCNHLVVSSYSSDTVMIMTTDGELVHEFGGYGKGPGQFWRPGGVAVDNQGCVYVCDWGNERVQVWRS